MTVPELINTLECRRKGYAYQVWKNATLIGQVFSKKFPSTPEKASPELYPPKPSIPMPEILRREQNNG